MMNEYDKRNNITSVTQISMLTLISRITGQFELNNYYSNKMTERPGDYTLHNILSTLYTVEVIEA